MVEQQVPGEHFVCDESQGILVGPAVAGQAGRLLRRGVGRGAGKGPVQGLAKLPGQSQVEDLEMALLGRPDVLGLQVPMHDVPAVCEVQGLGLKTTSIT